MTYNKSIDSGRTTMQIAMSHDDKVSLKVIAATEGITVAALIHKWIEEHASSTSLDSVSERKA